MDDRERRTAPDYINRKIRMRRVERDLRAMDIEDLIRAKRLIEETMTRYNTDFIGALELLR